MPPKSRVVAKRVVEDGNTRLIDALLWGSRYLSKYDIDEGTEKCLEMLEKITQLERVQIYVQFGDYRLSKNQAERYINMVERLKEGSDG